MTTTTLTNAPSNTFGRLATAFLAELRRAIELAGAPYVNSPLPPL